MKQLIVTADDFGLLDSINEGIVKAFGEGVVSYVSLIPTGEAFAKAVDLARSNGITEAGAHLALTETRPVSRPSDVPALVRRDGGFPRHNPDLFLRLFSGRIPRIQIYAELRNQLELLKSTGINITSISSHEHIHMMPALLGMFIELALEFGIPCIRYPRRERLHIPLTPAKLYKKTLLSLLGPAMEGPIKRSGLKHTDHFAGFLDSGSMRSATLEKIVSSLEDGSTELVCHPGFVSPAVIDRCIFFLDCETELAALTSRQTRDLVREESIELSTFGSAFCKRTGT
jgi:hopanoid biosynthesis associated protein HpnK